ncbi:unnamed protein product [marine sediment metagenome]|uniref:Uncharacterized protein n=1 Tax=marine sediment metagenome TaxID=412755 RepID=X0XU33_9ZZZZ
MSELSHYYNEIARNPSTWSNPDASVCGCGGGGWWLSEVDTWHSCPAHNNGQRHPEDDPDCYEDLEVPEPAPTPAPKAERDDDLPF